MKGPMHGRVRATLLFSVLAGAVLPTVAGADFLVRQIRCADLQPGGVILYSNFTDSTRRITLQVVKDRCSPRGSDGRFFLWSKVGAATTDVKEFRRHRGYTNALGLNVPDLNDAVLSFSAARNARGTVEVMFSVE